MGQKSKLKVKIFHIFLTASGEGGVNPSGQPDRFFPFFYPFPYFFKGFGFVTRSDIAIRWKTKSTNTKREKAVIA